MPSTIGGNDEFDVMEFRAASDLARPETPYMYHCHMLLHEDQGMMGQFVVIEPGQEHLVGAAPSHDHHVD